jgi:glycosyltransferase involved in cell wall biosynthesis
VRGFVAGYVGRLVEEKGLMDMVDALAACSSEINLLFVGSGPLKSL